ncbi:hypothetical protein MBLNU459_g0187t1 [Dothideomycetes sp. NU459]
MFGISYWILPIFAACVWLATLLAMLITWITEGSPHYASMSQGQHIAYISDIGAEGLKPLFIAGSTVTVVVFDFVFISERWLRHKGRLAHNTSLTQKVLSIFAIIFAIIGALGLIFLTIFDTVHYHHVHDAMLCVFIGGYVISAIFICAEYQRLGIHFREHRVLRLSFWLKLAFIFVEVALAIAFGVMSDKEHYNRAAVLEWVVSLIYILYVASFAMDFLPAIHSKHHRFPPVTEHQAIEQGEPTNAMSMTGGPVYSDNNYSNGSYASTQPKEQSVAPSRNF